MILAMIVALAAKGIVTAAIVGLGIALIGQIEGHILHRWTAGSNHCNPDHFGDLVNLL